MQRATNSRAEILRRIAEITLELQGARNELKNLPARDTATGEVVIRAARLSRERARLERCLEALRLDPETAVASVPSESRGRT